MNRDADNVEEASSLPVRAASLPPKCSAGKDARRTGSQDGCATVEAITRFCGRGGRVRGLVYGADMSKRLVLIVPSFPKLSETFILSKFLGLLERGWDVHMVCGISEKAQYRHFPNLENHPW